MKRKTFSLRGERVHSVSLQSSTRSASCVSTGSGFRVQGSGFRVQGSGFRIQDSGFRGLGLETATRSASCVSTERFSARFRVN